MELEELQKEVAVISEEVVEQKPPIKKRILVASLLTLAAVGTHWLPGRTIVADALEPQRPAAIAVASDKVDTGPNSLLGDVVTDNRGSLSLASADLTPYHLNVGEVVDQAGLSKMLNGFAPLSGDANGPNAAALIATSSVPEPKTAGLILLAAAPVFIRRKTVNRSVSE